jgi:CubicO group peptidase (beta-lactamase class C family)
MQARGWASRFPVLALLACTFPVGAEHRHMPVERGIRKTPVSPQPDSNAPFGPAFDAYVRQTMERSKLPGVVIVIVKHGSALPTKGYGTRVSGENCPVSETTLVQVASQTDASSASRAPSSRRNLFHRSPIR